MKAKLKGANGFVRFLLNHGEKVGIAVILGLAGMLIWSSLGRPVVEESKQPPALTTAANSAKSKVENMSWENFPAEQKTDFASFRSRSGDGVANPVKPGDYPGISAINPPLIPPVKLRQDPVLVTAADLQVRPGAGLWMSSDPESIRENMREAAQKAAEERAKAEEEAARMEEEGGQGEGGRMGRGMGPGGRGGFGEGPRGGFGGEGGRGMGMGMGEMGGMKTKDGVMVIPPMGGAPMQGFEEIFEQSWVTVLAKVPIKQQIQMYEDALATARGFNVNADLPQYIGYEVERAEVTDEGTGKFTLLKRVLPKTIIDRMATWPTQTPDLVNPKYIHPLLTFPLPPMVMREWGDEITHTDLPIPTPEELMGPTEPDPSLAPKPAEPADDSADPFGSAARRATTPGAMGGGYAGRGGEMGMGRPMGGGGYGGYGGRGAGEMGMGRPMGMGGRGGESRGGPGMGGMGGGMSPTELPEYTWDGVTKTLLFRFFDDNVEPGRRYRYRVRLVLKDVNADQPKSFLDPTVSVRQTKEKLRYRMTDWSEPSPVAVVPRPGLTYVAQTKDIGTPEAEARLIIKSVDSVNAAEVAMDNWYPLGSVLNFAQKAKIIWSTLYKIDPEEPQESPSFKFLTGLTLVDLDGGEQLGKNRNLMAPARALMMDSSGRLLMQNELAQQKTIKGYDFIMQQDAEATRRAREMGDGERGPGGRGGGRGGRGGF